MGAPSPPAAAPRSCHAQMTSSLLRQLLQLLLLVARSARAFSCKNALGWITDYCYDSEENIKSSENPNGDRYVISYYFNPHKPCFEKFQQGFPEKVSKGFKGIPPGTTPTVLAHVCEDGECNGVDAADLQPFALYSMPTGETYGCYLRKATYSFAVIQKERIAIACPPGYQVHKYFEWRKYRDFHCYQCDTGTYSDDYNSKPEDCTRCPTGYTTRGPGAKSYSACYRPRIVANQADAGDDAVQAPQKTLSSLALVRHSSGGAPAVHASAAAFLVLAAAIAATARREAAV